MRKRYTLSYTSREGTRIVLYNLLHNAESEIRRIQSWLGSRDFDTQEQTHHFSQYEIDLIKERVNA